MRHGSRRSTLLAAGAVSLSLLVAACSSSPKPTASHRPRHSASSTPSASDQPSSTPTSSTPSPSEASSSGAPASLLTFDPKSAGRHSHTCIQVTGTAPVDYIYYPVIVTPTSAVTLDTAVGDLRRRGPGGGLVGRPRDVQRRHRVHQGLACPADPHPEHLCAVVEAGRRRGGDAGRGHVVQRRSCTCGSTPTRCPTAPTVSCSPTTTRPVTTPTPGSTTSPTRQGSADHPYQDVSRDAAPRGPMG